MLPPIEAEVANHLGICSLRYHLGNILQLLLISDIKLLGIPFIWDNQRLLELWSDSWYHGLGRASGGICLPRDKYVSLPTCPNIRFRSCHLQDISSEGMGAASYRYLPPWAVANIGQKDETSEKFEEEDLKLAEPLTRQGYTGPGQIPDTEYRSSRSENQQAEYSHHGDEQLADTMAQRLL